jgi:methionine-rich copper-binding protein CopC
LARSLLRALLSASLLSQLLIAPASAHAALQSATPGPGDEVPGSPVELVLRFTQDLDPSRTSLDVRDAVGASVARGGELGEGPREYRLSVPELEPGEYEVRWTTYSAEDGELARDVYTFTVIAVASPSPSPTASASAPPSLPPTTAPPLATPTPATPTPTADPNQRGVSDSADLAGAIVPIVVALLVVGAVAIWLTRRRTG